MTNSQTKMTVLIGPTNKLTETQTSQSFLYEKLQKMIYQNVLVYIQFKLKWSQW